MYGPKNQMRKYQGYLKRGDIILVEFYVTRWTPRTTSSSTRGDKKPAFAQRTVWNNYVVEFRMDAISVLYPGSDYFKVATRPDESFLG